MKKITLKYNPYTITTEFTVDNNKPKADSLLNVGHSRIQEWADMLPGWLKKEYNDNCFDIIFTGTPDDFNDFKQGLESDTTIRSNITYVRKPDVNETENIIDQIFTDIQNGPIEELKNNSIIEAFNKAKNSHFEISVVACVSSGKSTLINALLGQRLMPAKNEATTSTIVKITDSSMDNINEFIAEGFDKNGEQVLEKTPIDLELMKVLNDREDICTINIDGPIPFVNTTGMKLVLVDTPGPNNSRNKKHEEMTYKMLSDSDKSLVLFVINAEQQGINDENLFLDYICECMKKGGKQSKDRFIFVVNKINMYDPREEADGPGCIKKVLSDIKNDLEKRGIQNPNIFPVAALPALEKRINDRREFTLHSFRYSVEDFEEMQFDKYYNFSHLPLSSQNFIENAKKTFKGDDLVEIQTGICNLEEAIRLYINKYARTTKIMDLVLSFNSALQEISAVSKIEEMIRKDVNAKHELEEQIASIRNNVEIARNAQSYSKTIEEFDVKPEIMKEVKGLISATAMKINALMCDKGTKVELSVAQKDLKSIKHSVSAMYAQVKAQIENSLEKNFKLALSEMLSFYKQYLEELNVNTDYNLYDISPIKIVEMQLSKVDSIIKHKSFTIKENCKETKTNYLSKKEGSTIGGILGAGLATIAFSWAAPIAFFAAAAVGGLAGGILGHKDSTTTEEVDVEKDVTYVNLEEVVADYLQPIQVKLNQLVKSVEDYVDTETDNLRNVLKLTLEEINTVLENKLDVLSHVVADNEAIISQIDEKEKQIIWIKDIEKRLNDVVNF